MMHIQEVNRWSDILTKATKHSSPIIYRSMLKKKNNTDEMRLASLGIMEAQLRAPWYPSNHHNNTLFWKPPKTLETSQQYVNTSFWKVLGVTSHFQVGEVNLPMLNLTFCSQLMWCTCTQRILLNQTTTLITLFRYIWHQMDLYLVPNLSVKCNYNPNSVW